MTPRQTFDSVCMILRNAAPDLSIEEFDEVVDSINEWTCDVINSKVRVYADVDYPYQQGDGDSE